MSVSGQALNPRLIRRPAHRRAGRIRPRRIYSGASEASGSVASGPRKGGQAKRKPLSAPPKVGEPEPQEEPCHRTGPPAGKVSGAGGGAAGSRRSPSAVHCLSC